MEKSQSLKMQRTYSTNYENQCPKRKIIWRTNNYQKYYKWLTKWEVSHLTDHQLNINYNISEILFLIIKISNIVNILNSQVYSEIVLWEKHANTLVIERKKWYKIFRKVFGSMYQWTLKINTICLNEFSSYNIIWRNASGLNTEIFRKAVFGKFFQKSTTAKT